MAVKALVFDVFGTVVDWRGSLITELSEWGGARSLQVDWAAFADAWRAAYAPSMDRVRKGEMGWTTIDVLHRAALEELVTRFGIGGLGPDDMDWVNRAWHRLLPWPDSVAGLSRLKARYTLGTLSNGNVSLLVDMARHAGLPWDVVLSAELFRHYKPDPETYLGAAALLGLEPAEVMLCAAHNGDLAAARANGLRTAFILRPTEYGPAQRKDLSAESDWDHVVGSITELADRIG